MKVIDYKIVHDYDAAQLEREVRALINNPYEPADDGWQPHGPLIVERVLAQPHYSGTVYTIRYIQAMVKVS